MKLSRLLGLPAAICALLLATLAQLPDGTYMYQINKDHNGCLSCHARTKAEEMRAIAISPTHYVDRDGHQLADVSPRRFFCTQCHVPQADAKPLVTNTFVDVDQLLKRKPDGKSVGKN